MPCATASRQIERDTSDLRTRLFEHPIYGNVNGLGRLREFMRNHVFAVWDFMSLLKRLEREVAGCDVPWLPPADPQLARFVKEIVLGEECDADGCGGYASHFDLYLAAMDDVGADRRPIETLLERLRAGRSAAVAFEGLDLPASTREFVLGNLRLAAEGQPHEVAAAFCYGREDVIPEMFRRLTRALEADGHRLDRLTYYFQRHIELDGDDHGPAAQRLVDRLCAGDAARIAEATAAARNAIEARIRLWDGILEAMDAEAHAAA